MTEQKKGRHIEQKGNEWRTSPVKIPVLVNAMREIYWFLKSRSTANLAMVMINVCVFVIMEFLGDTQSAQFMAEHGAFYLPWVVEYGEYYRLFTCMFLHFGIEHLFNNMLVLLFLGDTLEREVGKIRYLVIYIGGGLAGNVISAWHSYRTQDFAVSAGASGAVFAVIGALLFVVAIHKGRLEQITGRRLFLMAALTLFQGFTSIGVDNWAHIGGLISGLILGAALFNWKKWAAGR